MEYEPVANVGQSERCKEGEPPESGLSATEPTHPILNLQRAIGNQAVQRLFQANLANRQPRDGYVQRAHQVPKLVVGSSSGSTVQTKCSCGGTLGATGECEECHQKRISLQRDTPNSHNGQHPAGHPFSEAGQQDSTKSTDSSEAKLGQPNGESENPGANIVEPDKAARADPLSERLPGSPHACVMNAALPYARSGNLRSSDGSVGEKFEVRAEWQSAPALARGETSYCAAECGEYHQFIKGHMLSSPNKDGSALSDVSGTLFGGKPLDENDFREDGLNRNPQARYGHRQERQMMDEKYEPDRATGPKYVGRDFPQVMTGTFADIDVTFLGKLVDTCNQTENLSAQWQVQYRGIIRP